MQNVMSLNLVSYFKFIGMKSDFLLRMNYVLSTAINYFNLNLLIYTLSWVIVQNHYKHRYKNNYPKKIPCNCTFQFLYIVSKQTPPENI